MVRMGFVGGQGLRQTEVQNLHVAVRRDLDVGGLQVPVDDALLMGLLQRFRHLAGDQERLLDGKGSALQPLGKIVALHQLQHQEETPFGLFHPVDGGNVGMIQRSEKLGLAAEPGQALGGVRHPGGEGLDRHLPAQLRVLGTVDLAHSAGAQLRRDAVVQKRFADHCSSLNERCARMLPPAVVSATRRQAARKALVLEPS
jgi:hypothetical protein